MTKIKTNIKYDDGELQPSEKIITEKTEEETNNTIINLGNSLPEITSITKQEKPKNITIKLHKIEEYTQNGQNYNMVTIEVNKNIYMIPGVTKEGISTVITGITPETHQYTYWIATRPDVLAFALEMVPGQIVQIYVE